MRLFLTLSLALILSQQVFPQIVINEFCSSNLNVIVDEDGDNPDWIELYNNSDSDVNLDGYLLSDNPAYLSKWILPAVSIKPDSYLLIFASGKNRNQLPLTYQTIIPKGSNWKYIVPISDLGNAWKNTGYDATNWKTGNSGFGYGDNDDATVVNSTISVFIRKEFTISNLQDIEQLVLSIDYDDGFVAYVNGHEIARSNLGAAGTFVPYNVGTGSLQREASMYQGGLPENFKIDDPQNFLVQGINVLAIQGHNTNAGSSDLSLIPMLSLGMSGTGYTSSLPPYIQLGSSYMHTGFKISSEGETLILSRPDSSFIDSVAAIPLLANISFGRKPDGDAPWFYFSDPTPGAANSSKAYDVLSSDTVSFSFQGGYFPRGLEIQLSPPDPVDSIYFTTDGSEPSTSSMLYKNPIPLSKNTVLRARSINSQKLPGMVFTNTYITRQHTMPVVCLSTKPSNLFDYNTGIYELGPNASTENPNFGANFWEDWERPAHMELYDVDGVKQIDQGVGIKIFGAWSRANPQKSISLFARREYGKSSFEYRFFKDKPIEVFESLVLRNAGNDWAQAFMRDGLTSSLVKDMDMDRQAFQPTILYINGEYWGILNMREKVNVNFLAENHFVNPDNINLLEGNGTVVDGSNIAYQQMISYLNTHTLESEANYLGVSGKIDVNNYIQYQLTQIYINNKDWPGNNIKFWNTNTPGSLWRWIIYDTDFGWGIWDGGAYAFNTLEFALEPNYPDWPNPTWSTLLFRRMMSNPGFRAEFANQFADRMNTNFTPEKIIAVIDSLRQIFQPEINDQMIRWGQSYSNWLNNYTAIKSFANARPAYMRNFLNAKLGSPGKLDISVEISAPGAGAVKLNSIVPENYPFSGVYFKNIPIKLTAFPAPGYTFLRWEGNVNSNELSIDYNMSESATLRAVFSEAGVDDYKIVINEINYSSSPEKDTKDWVELYNAGNTSVNLKNWVVSEAGPELGFVFNDDLIMTPGTYLVICREMEAFRLLIPDVKNTIGNLPFGLGSNGNDINLYDADGVLIDFVNYTPNQPWPTDANGTGSTIELTNAWSDNNNGSNWISSPDGGSPGVLNHFTFPLIDKETIASAAFALDCYPNPFRDYTSLRIEAPVAGDYKLEVYDLQGRTVNILAKQVIDAGVYYFDWDGSDSNNNRLPGGVYIVRLSGANLDLHLKVVLMK